jgi:hypothetical protein
MYWKLIDFLKKIGLVKFLLGGNEKQHRLAYVGMSRDLAYEQIGIFPGCSLERLNIKWIYIKS